MQWIGAAATVLLLGGCSLVGGSPDEEPDADPTTLTSYDAREAAVVRGPFCDRLSPTGVEHALGAVPEESEQWENGDRVRLPDGTRDRVHEFGCRWTGDGSVATAYLFVPPVTPRQARSLARDSVGPGCSTFAAQGFGRPNVATRCVDGDATTTELTYRGLFGDAWVACSLQTPGDPASLPTRASAWCVEVLEATRA